ncbi:unnamed protein product [Musa textilis]
MTRRKKRGCCVTDLGGLAAERIHGQRFALESGSSPAPHRPPWCSRHSEWRAGTETSCRFGPDLENSQRRFGAGGTRSGSLSRPAPAAAATDWLETCWTSVLSPASGCFFGLARLWVMNEFNSLACVF